MGHKTLTLSVSVCGTAYVAPDDVATAQSMEPTDAADAAADSKLLYKSLTSITRRKDDDEVDVNLAETYKTKSSLDGQLHYCSSSLLYAALCRQHHQQWRVCPSTPGK